jgi:peptidoglycan/LPS O-acetylase OafA/YrhL
VTSTPATEPLAAIPATATSGRGLPYSPGLDGLRAVAVGVVLLFHAGTPWAPGGFLGVDLFFVISGFLITSLLISGSERHGRVRLGDFYLRRARRLLPALYLLLVAVTLVCALFVRDELAGLGGQVLSALAYVTNWYFIVEQQSYFTALGRPPLLLHLWSLAVEEQFYIVWALVMAVALPRVGRRRKGLAVGLVIGIVASTALMAALYDPFGDPSRVYYGTFTHGAPLLVGALLALGWTPSRLRADLAPGAKALLDGVGAAALVGFIWLVAHATESSTWMYRGGFLVAAVLGALVVAVTVHPGARLGRLLGVAPLLWLGVRSYSVYLWHWPVFMLSRPDLDVPLHGLPLMVARLSVTLLLADLTYRYVETPVRHGALGRWAARLRSSEGPDRVRLVASTGVAAVSTVAVVALAGAQLLHPPATLSVAVDRSASESDKQAKVDDTLAEASSGERVPGAAFGPSHPLPDPLRVTVVGDSQGMTLLLNVSDGVTDQFGFTDGTVEGCGVLEGRIESSQGMRRDLGAECRGWSDQWRRSVADSQAQIALVMIGAWDVFDVEVGGRRMAFGTPAWDAYFTRQLEKGIASVERAGAVVVLAHSPCYRPISAGGLPALPERGDDARVQHLNELMSAAADADPAHVTTVEPPRQFCTRPGIASNVSYRWDGVHYYVPGANLFMRAVGPQLLAVAHHVPE